MGSGKVVVCLFCHLTKLDFLQKNENDPDVCQYRGYRMAYNSTEPYDLSPVYWHVFAARLAFVVIFEHLVFIITAFMQFLIPDVGFLTR